MWYENQRSPFAYFKNYLTHIQNRFLICSDGNSTYLEGRNFSVMQLRHVVIRQGIAGLLADFEPGVELEHFQELQSKVKIKFFLAFIVMYYAI